MTRVLLVVALLLVATAAFAAPHLPEPPVPGTTPGPSVAGPVPVMAAPAPLGLEASVVQGFAPVGETGASLSYMVKDLVLLRVWADGGLVKNAGAGNFGPFVGVSTDLNFLPLIGKVISAVSDKPRYGGGYSFLPHEWFGYVRVPLTDF